MKSKTKVLFLLTLLIIFLFSSIFNCKINKVNVTNNKYLEFNEKNQIQINQSGSWDLTGNPIYIDDLVTGVGAHNWTWAENQPWCSGSGNWTDPYVIENVTIDRQGSGNSIEIRNSDAYFIIRNCFLYNSDYHSYDNAGIKLYYVDNGKIINNNCSDNFYGILLLNSNNNTLSGNTIIDNRYGIELSESVNNTLSGNIMNFCGIFLVGSLVESASHSIDYTNLVNNKPVYYYANKHSLGSSNFTNAGQIILINCSNSLISGLNLSNGNTGINLGYSDNITISGNIVSNNLFGIDLINSDNNTISGNTVNNNSCGINISYSNNNTVSENHVSYNNAFGMILAYSNNNTVSRNTANYCYFYGIGLYDCDDNIVSENVFSQNHKGGINIEDSDNNTISENIADNNGEYGIGLYESDINTVSENKVSNHNLFGICLLYSNYNSISRNTANNNSYGINICCSNNNTVSGNTANYNCYGIYLVISDNNSVSENTVNNNGDGIYIEDSDNNTISRNSVNNNYFGIYLYSGSYNTIFFNSFTNSTHNAHDDGTNNKWDNGTIGNYWDDYQGVDANDDGIGDTPYLIPGSAGSQDNFPILNILISMKYYQPFIPFGNYFLLFTVIAILSLIILEKRKKK